MHLEPRLSLSHQTKPRRPLRIDPVSFAQNIIFPEGDEA